MKGLGKRTVNLASLDIVGDVLGAAAIDLAADGEGSTEDLEDSTAELLGHGAGAHGAGNLDDVVEGDGLGVLDVLLLLAVTRRLLEGLDHEGRGGGNNGDSGLTVLDGQAHGDTETLPVTSVLGDIFTNLLGRQTEGTDLGGQSGLGTDFTTSHTQVAKKELLVFWTKEKIFKKFSTYMIFTSLGSNLGADQEGMLVAIFQEAK